jgi:uncharacterized protein (DUF2235 family)
MAKQIALFLDGTRNTDKPSGGMGTISIHILHAATTGLKKYIKGIAADGDDRIESITRLGTGKKIREAYRFLTLNYERGDSIYTILGSVGGLSQLVHSPGSPFG